MRHVLVALLEPALALYFHDMIQYVSKIILYYASLSVNMT